jgi:hypothetical protein
MSKKSTLEKIEKETEKLTPEEQLKLVEDLIHRLNANGIIKEKEDWGKLYSLGKGLWKEDAQDYVNKLRKDRF